MGGGGSNLCQQYVHMLTKRCTSDRDWHGKAGLRSACPPLRSPAPPTGGRLLLRRQRGLGIRHLLGQVLHILLQRLDCKQRTRRGP